MKMTSEGKLRAPEILAPAGNLETLEYAIRSGADAVYVGGLEFSARARAANFSESELKSALNKAKDFGVKVYVAVNTLIFDEELERAFRFCEKIKYMGVDAVIVQDIGLAYLVGKYLRDKNFQLHMSTQASIYNFTGVKNSFLLLKGNLDRVVLARELKREEISFISHESKRLGVETEVFVHGALCVSYSGQCNLSRYLGGRSANRGECAQPCRLSYRNGRGEKSCFLSPKDLCLIDELPSLIKSGVASLKIEGRMKSKEYVATVTEIYKKYLKLALQSLKGQSFYTVEDADRDLLKEVYNRGGFSKGLYRKEKVSLMCNRLPGHEGVRVGKIEREEKGCIKPILEEKPVSKGDVLEIRSGSRQKAVCTVTFLERSERHAFVGDFKGNVKEGDIVFRISSQRIKERVRRNLETKPKQNVNFIFEGKQGKCALLTANSGEFTEKVYSSIPIEAAVHVPLDEKRIEGQLSKLGGTRFRAGNIVIKMQKGSIIPIREINSMRRRIIDTLEKKNKEMEEESEVYSEADIKDELNCDAVPVYSQGKDSISKDEGSIPSIVFSAVTRGREDEEIESYIADLNDDKKNDVVQLNNLGWAKEFLDKGCKLIGGRGLNAVNCVSEKVFKNFGFSDVMRGKELINSREELMISAYPLTEGEYMTDRDEKLIIERRKYGHDFIIRGKK